MISGQPKHTVSVDKIYSAVPGSRCIEQISVRQNTYHGGTGATTALTGKLMDRPVETHDTALQKTAKIHRFAIPDPVKRVGHRGDRRLTGSRAIRHAAHPVTQNRNLSVQAIGAVIPDLSVRHVDSILLT